MSKKKIVIFGANGKVGRQLVQQSLAKGYMVTAFVHRRNTLPKSDGLTVVKGDVRQSADVEKALVGADAVLSALSSWGTKDKNVLSSAMHVIIPAMKKQKVSRIISVTGADAEAPGDTRGAIHSFTRFIIGIVGRKVIVDAEKHIEKLAASGLDWTVVRSPVMIPGNDKRYVLTDKRPLPIVVLCYQAVATAMVDLLDHGDKKRLLYVSFSL